MDSIAGGWTLAFTTHYQSGTPLTVTDTNGTPIPIGDPYLPGGIKDRLGDKVDPKTNLPLNPYLSPDVWIHVANFRVSPEPVRWSWLRGPTRWQQTITMTKSITLTEGWKLELRALANSPFNHPYFDDPSTDLSSPATFGVIDGASGTRAITFGAKVRF